jgi:membrane-associated phospholipid phosphatase
MHDWSSDQGGRAGWREVTVPPLGPQGKRLIGAAAVVRRLGRVAVVAGLLLGRSGDATAQAGPTIPLGQPATIQWWHGAVALGGLSVLMLLDEPVQQFTQDNRGSTADDIARTMRRFGQPEVFGTITLGLLGAGLVSGDQDITRSGGRLAAALALAGGAATVAKWGLGRPRPSTSLDADEYVPFSGRDALPSGHTSVAFALATALADDIQRTWASALLYSLAAGVAWSRINDNRHWLSDAASGAALGITAAKVVNGRWRIFNLRPPRLLLGPQNAQIAWRVTF